MVKQLIQEIHGYIDNSETGRLEVRHLQHSQQCWSLYFVLGRLIWVDGGQHPYRRIDRHLKTLCVEAKGISIEETNLLSLKDYNLLGELVKTNQLSINQFANISTKINLEVLFNLFQTLAIPDLDQTSSNGQLYWQWFPKERPTKYIPIPSVADKSSVFLLETAQKHWQQWQEVGLKNCFPDQAPIMTHPENIKGETNAATFENMKRLLTGEQTLREIAVETNRDAKTVAQVLWQYYQKGWVSFKDIPDFNWDVLIAKSDSSLSASASSTPQKKQKFLIACVDDSSQVTQTLEKILRHHGYDFLGINDPLRASATLLKTKPDLIFLDLIMPHTNGYEICTQLRRVSSLQATPIIILTGKDGLIDRMRAKMVGATQYISKPVQRSTLLETVQKYLLIHQTFDFSVSNMTATISQ